MTALILNLVIIALLLRACITVTITYSKKEKEKTTEVDFTVADLVKIVPTSEELIEQKLLNVYREGDSFMFWFVSGDEQLYKRNEQFYLVPAHERNVEEYISNIDSTKEIFCYADITKVWEDIDSNNPLQQQTFNYLITL